MSWTDIENIKEFIKDTETLKTGEESLSSWKIWKITRDTRNAEEI